MKTKTQFKVFKLTFCQNKKIIIKRLLGGVNPQTHYVLFQFQHLFQIIDLLKQIHVLIELLYSL